MSGQSPIWKSLRAVQAILAAPLVIASAIEVFKHYGALAWLDAQLAAIIARSNLVALVTSGQEANVPAIKLQRRQELPPVIVIDDELYKDYFKQKSPLDRGRLARLIDSIAAWGPKVLAIDLDLSPDLGRYDTDTPERALYEALCRAAWGSELAIAQARGQRAESCLGSVGRFASSEKCPARPLVLIDPFPVHDEKANVANATWRTWLQRSLGACLRFSSSEIIEHDNIVSHFDKNGRSLGLVAYAATKGALGQERDRSAAQNAKRDYAIINVASFVAAAFDRSLPAGVDGLMLLKPRYDADRDELKLSAAGNARVRDGVVFLGGTWGEYDKHVTVVANDVPGVVVHAAIFQSIGQWYLGASWLLFLIDVSLGVCLGRRLKHFAEEGRAAQALLAITRARQGASRFGPGSDCARLQYLFVWKWWGAFVLLVASTIALSWIVSGVMFGTSLVWFSPATLILGMAIHAMFEAGKVEADPHAEDDACGAGAPRRQPSALVAAKADLLWSRVGYFVWVGSRIAAVLVVVVGIYFAVR